MQERCKLEPAYNEAKWSQESHKIKQFQDVRERDWERRKDIKLEDWAGDSDEHVELRNFLDW